MFQKAKFCSIQFSLSPNVCFSMRWDFSFVLIEDVDIDVSGADNILLAEFEMELILYIYMARWQDKRRQDKLLKESEAVWPQKKKRTDVTYKLVSSLLFLWWLILGPVAPWDTHRPAIHRWSMPLMVATSYSH